MKRRLFAGLLLSTLFLVGCQKSEDKTAPPKGKSVNVEQLATRVRGKYEDDSKADYSGEKLTVKRDENLKLDIGFDPKDKGMKDFTEVVEIFQDPDLTQSFSTQFVLNDAHTEIQVKPWKSPVAAISTLDLKQDVDGNEAGALHLLDKGEGKDWGNLPQLYMAVKRSSYKLTTVGFYDNKALVNVKLDALSRENISRLIGDYESAYLDATDDYDYKKAEEDTYNKYREILDKSDLVESSDKLNIMMSKKDGKWDIKMKNVDDSQNEYLLQSYVGDVMDY